MRRRERLLAAAAILVALLAFAGCGRRGPGAEGGRGRGEPVSRPTMASPRPGAASSARGEAALRPRDGGTVRIGLWTAPRGVFNPLFATDPADREINALIHAGLLRPGPDLAPRPGLARAYAVSADQRTIVFSLDTGARWHDGQPVSPDDVLFTFETVLHRDYRGPYREAFLFIEGARAYRDGKAAGLAGVRVLGDRAVAFKLSQPYGPALMAIGMLPILPRHAFAGVAVKDMAGAAASRERPVGAGPFRVASAGRDRVELVRYEAFFRGRPHLERVAFTVVGPQLGLASLQEGVVDILQVNAADAPAVERAGLVVRDWPEPGYYYVGINMNYRPLDDRRVRQALAYALDREAMVARLFAGHATLLAAPLPPGSWGEAPRLEPYRHDADRARRLLAEAGISDEDGDGLVERKGRPFELNLVFDKGAPPAREIAELVRDQLRRAGIQVYLRGMERRELLDRVFARRAFDLYLLQWRMGLDPDASAVFGPDAAANAVSFKNRRAQELLKQGLAMVDVAKRRPLYHEWSRLVNAEVPYIFLFAPNRVIAVSPRLHGLTVTPAGYAYGAEGWWVDR